jgi:hypothetical protein
MNTTYASELGKCYAKRGNLRIYRENGTGSLAVYLVTRELLWDADYNFKKGTRLEATRVGYVFDLANAEYAFDMAEAELNVYTKEAEAEFGVAVQA